MTNCININGTNALDLTKGLKVCRSQMESIIKFLIFVDFQKMYEEYCKIRHSSYIAGDRVHPNQVGATLMAMTFLEKAGFQLKPLSNDAEKD